MIQAYSICGVIVMFYCVWTYSYGHPDPRAIMGKNPLMFILALVIVWLLWPLVLWAMIKAEQQ